MSDSVTQPHGLQPARFPCPWHFPGKSTSLGCCFLLQGNPLGLGAEPASLASPKRWPVNSTAAPPGKALLRGSSPFTSPSTLLCKQLFSEPNSPMWPTSKSGLFGHPLSENRTHLSVTDRLLGRKYLKSYITLLFTLAPPSLSRFPELRSDSLTGAVHCYQISTLNACLASKPRNFYEPKFWVQYTSNYYHGLYFCNKLKIMYLCVIFTKYLLLAYFLSTFRTFTMSNKSSGLPRWC